jgi:hypothetical protein
MWKNQLFIDLLPIHAVFNILMGFLLAVQGLIGFRIRLRRKAGAHPALRLIKFHRKLGPTLVYAGIAGYISGLVIAYIGTGRLLNYPPHAFVGALIAVSLIANYHISGKIRGTDVPWRKTHFLLGALILLLYGIQVYLGLKMFSF